MSLENKYEAAEANEQAIINRIRQACEVFVRNHPEFYACSQNEKILFAAMRAPENDHLSPDSAASWADVYAQCRDRLIERPAPRRQSAPVSRLTLAEINSWTAKELQRQIESSPRREAEINAVLSQR